MLEVEGLHVWYGAVPALRGVSLKVEPRSITSIVGANGAGKTTLLRAIMGHLAPREGAVRLGGEVISGAPAHIVCRKGVALVPEGRGLFAQLSVYENLMLGAFAVKDRRRTRATLAEVYDLFPLLADRKRQVSGTLSGGEQQILSIARGLMSNPDLLMLDEPSLGVMPSFVNLIFDVLAEIRGRGTTVLLVEQNVERSLRIADYAYVLQTGRVALEGEARSLLEEELVRKAYLGL